MLVDKFIQLNRSHRRVLLTALVVIAGIGLYRWIFAPFNAQLLASQRYDTVLDRVIRKADFMGTLLAVKRAKLGELLKKTGRLRKEMFTPQEVQDFFASLPNVAHVAGCTVPSVSMVPEQQGGSQNQTVDSSGVVPRKATVTVIGGYNNIVKFLKEVQTAEQKVWIESMRLVAGDNAGKLKCQVVLTLYCIERVETALYE